MDPQNQNVQPVVSAPAKKVGPIVAIFAIVVIILAVVIYLAVSGSNKYAPTQEINTSLAQGAATVQSQNLPVDSQAKVITSTDDDLQSIQNDLNSSTRGLDSQNF